MSNYPDWEELSDVEGEAADCYRAMKKELQQNAIEIRRYQKAIEAQGRRIKVLKDFYGDKSV